MQIIQFYTHQYFPFFQKRGKCKGCIELALVKAVEPVDYEAFCRNFCLQVCSYVIGGLVVNASGGKSANYSCEG